jgi:hypothetical protein
MEQHSKTIFRYRVRFVPKTPERPDTGAGQPRMLKKCDSWQSAQYQNAKLFAPFCCCPANEFPGRVVRLLHSLPSLQRKPLAGFLPMRTIKKF